MRILLTVLATSLSNVQAETGTITGRVPMPAVRTIPIPVEKYRGKISGNVAPPSPRIAAVWLEGSTLSAPMTPAPVVLAQVNYQFTKSLIVIPLGTTVFFPNSDPDYHNVFSLSKTKRFDLGRYKATENPAPSIRFEKTGLVVLNCEIHDHMNANIVVVDSPHFISTDSQGKFKLTNIPPGNYNLHAQIDRKTSWRIPVQVRAKTTTRIQLPAK